jgi:hypothetical protein
VFFAYIGFIEDQFVFLSTDSTYLHVPGDKGGSTFSDLRIFSKIFFLGAHLHTNWCTTICITCPILHKIVRFLHEIECIELVCNKFVLVLVQIDLIQFENSNCIRSI